MKKPTNWWRDGVFHIETTFGIINIRPKLTSTQGETVDSIEFIIDGGAKALFPDGKEIRCGFNIRLMKDEGSRR